MRLLDLDAKEPYLLDGRYHIEPVKHGHWDEYVAIFFDVTSTIASVEKESMAHTPEIRKTIYRCSRCGLSNRSMTDYCPNCGALMNEVSE